MAMGGGVRQGFDTQTIREINALIATHHLLLRRAVNNWG
jgi:hypothetical protein